MYHQFKQLADIDITQEPMEVGPTTHYVMGGVRVDADTQMSSVPGIVRRRRMRRGDQWRQSAGRQFAFRPAGFRETRRRIRGQIRAGEFVRRSRCRARSTRRHGSALEPFERDFKQANGAYQVQNDLQEMMQDKVGIVRREDEMQAALKVQRALGTRGSGRRGWKSRIQSRLAHRARPAEFCSPFRKRSRARHLERKESRGAQFREDYPEKERGICEGEYDRLERRRRDNADPARADPGDARRSKRVIEEMK